MRRTVSYLLVFVIATCVASLVVPESSIFNFFMPSHITAEIAILLTAATAILFGLSGPLKDLFASMIGILGSGLMALSIIGIVSPTYFGLFYYFVPQSNLVTLFMLGLSFSLVSLELPHKNLIQQAADLRGLIALGNIGAADAEFKLWIVSHTAIVFHG